MNILLLFVISSSVEASLSDALADFLADPDVAEFLLSIESEDAEVRGTGGLSGPVVPTADELVVQGSLQASRTSLETEKLLVTPRGNKRESEYSESSNEPLRKRRIPPAGSLREAVLQCILSIGLKSDQKFVDCVQEVFPASSRRTIEQMRADVLSYTTVPVPFHERLSRLESWSDMTIQVEAELAALDPRPDVTRRAFVWFQYCISKSRLGKRIPPCGPLRDGSAMTLKQNVRKTYIRSLL